MISGVWIALVVALWVVVLALSVLVLGLIRKVDALPGVVVRKDGVPLLSKGPRLGSAAPAVSGFERLAGGRDGSLGGLVLFLSSSCGPCRRLADELRDAAPIVSAAGACRSEVELTLVTDPDGLTLFDDVGASVILAQNAGELSRAWSIPGTPFAVAIDKAGVVCGAAFTNTRFQVGELADVLRGESV